MGRFLAETVLAGRDERAAERFLLVAVGVSAGTLAVLTLGKLVWPDIPGVAGLVGLLFNAAYLVGTVSFASVYASRNDGLLVTLVGTFFLLLGYAVFLGTTFLLCLGTCPTLFEEIFFEVFVAAGAAVPAGLTAFAVGAGGRRLRERRT